MRNTLLSCVEWVIIKPILILVLISMFLGCFVFDLIISIINQKITFLFSGGFFLGICDVVENRPLKKVSIKIKKRRVNAEYRLSKKPDFSYLD